jgi:Gas vesicle protein G
MNPITWPFKLPLLPLRGTVRLAQTIQEEADRQLADPATVRRQLEDVERAHAAGEISDQEAADLEREIVARYTQVRQGTTAAADSDEAD